MSVVVERGKISALVERRKKLDTLLLNTLNTICDSLFIEVGLAYDEECIDKRGATCDRCSQSQEGRERNSWSSDNDCYCYATIIDTSKKTRLLGDVSRKSQR